MKTKSKKPTTQPLATTNPRRPSTNDQGRLHFDPPPPTISCPAPANHQLAPCARSVQILESLHRNYQEWALLVGRLHDEEKMTFRKIAYFVGVPVARIRLAYADAQELCAQLITLTNSN